MEALTNSVALKKATATLKASTGISGQTGHTEAIKQATDSLGETAMLSSFLRSGLLC